MRKMFSKKQIQNMTLNYIEGFDEIELSGDLIVDGDLEADKISGNEIVEKMEGYSFAFGEVSNLTIEGVYAGAVKNGNKLTLVIACNLTRTGTCSNSVLGLFTLPSEVLAKLIPTNVGAYPYLDNEVVKSWSNDSTYVNTICYLQKFSTNVQLKVDATPLNSLTLNTKYYFRYEVTFLLSENLIPSE